MRLQGRAAGTKAADKDTHIYITPPPEGRTDGATPAAGEEEECEVNWMETEHKRATSKLASALFFGLAFWSLERPVSQKNPQG